MHYITVNVKSCALLLCNSYRCFVKFLVRIVSVHCILYDVKWVRFEVCQPCLHVFCNNCNMFLCTGFMPRYDFRGTVLSPAPAGLGNTLQGNLGFFLYPILFAVYSFNMVGIQLNKSDNLYRTYMHGFGKLNYLLGAKLGKWWLVPMTDIN